MRAKNFMQHITKLKGKCRTFAVDRAYTCPLHGQMKPWMMPENLHFCLLVCTAGDAVGGGVYLQWWSEAEAGDPNTEGGCIPHTHEILWPEKCDEKKLTMSVSIVAPGFSTRRSSPHKLALTTSRWLREYVS